MEAEAASRLSLAQLGTLLVMPLDVPHIIRLSVQNLTERPLTVSLEPLGDWHDLQPGEIRAVTYRLDQEPALEIAVTNDALLIGDDGGAKDGDGLIFEV